MKIIIIITTIFFGLAMGQRIRRRELSEDAFGDHDPMLFSFKDPEDVDQSSTGLADPVTRRRTQSCPSFPGFVFWPGFDSPGNDIKKDDLTKVTLASMISSCNSNSSCKGLTTSGYHKSIIKPLNQWVVWKANACDGLYIKSSTSFVVNGYTLDAKEIAYLKWIAKWTVPNFGMSRYDAIKNYLGKATWWALKEQVLYMTNAYNHNLCNTATGDKVIGPLETCPWGRAWQVGIAAVQVTNWQSKASDVENRATSVYQQDIPTVLGRSAQQAGYSPGTATYNAIIKSTGTLRTSWLLKSHLVGFYFVEKEVREECLISTPKSWCYGTYGGSCVRCGRYAPDAASIKKRIDEVTVLLQSLTNGY